MESIHCRLGLCDSVPIYRLAYDLRYRYSTWSNSCNHDHFDMFKLDSLSSKHSLMITKNCKRTQERWSILDIITTVSNSCWVVGEENDIFVRITGKFKINFRTSVMAKFTNLREMQSFNWLCTWCMYG